MLALALMTDNAELLVKVVSLGTMVLLFSIVIESNFMHACCILDARNSVCRITQNTIAMVCLPFCMA